jgi:hypothetical protein
MATRSNIGMKVDGGWDYIYCHWDGYPSHNGMILLHNYLSDRDVSNLISGGDLSALGDSVENSVYYARDRGETGVDARFTQDRDHIYQEEWAYIWDDGRWLVKGKGSDWQPLTLELCNKDR